MRKMLTVVLFAIVFVSNAQESIVLRLNHEKGDMYVVTIDVSQGMGIAGKMNMKVVANLNVIDVKDDISHHETTFQKIKLDMVAGGNTMSYDSEMSDGELDEFGKELKVDMEPLLEIARNLWEQASHRPHRVPIGPPYYGGHMGTLWASYGGLRGPGQQRGFQRPTIRVP